MKSWLLEVIRTPAGIRNPEDDDKFPMKDSETDQGEHAPECNLAASKMEEWLQYTKNGLYLKLRSKLF